MLAHTHWTGWRGKREESIELGGWEMRVGLGDVKQICSKGKILNGAPGSGQRHLDAGIVLIPVRGRADGSPLFTLA